MTILAATDVSPCSLAAMHLAVATARRRHVSLTLVHTIEPLVVGPAAAPLGGEWDATIKTAAEQALEKQADDFRKAGIEVEVEVQVG